MPPGRLHIGVKPISSSSRGLLGDTGQYHTHDGWGTVRIVGTAKRGIYTGGLGIALKVYEILYQ